MYPANSESGAQRHRPEYFELCLGSSMVLEEGLREGEWMGLKERLNFGLMRPFRLGSSPGLNIGLIAALTRGLILGLNAGLMFELNWARGGGAGTRILPDQSVTISRIHLVGGMLVKDDARDFSEG